MRSTDKATVAKLRGRRVDRLILSHAVQPVRHNPPGKVVIDTSLAFSLREVWTRVYSPEPGTGLTFPETVQRLADLGVTRYRVDFVTNTTIAYIGGSAHLYHFPSYATEEVIPGSIPWSLEKLRTAIKKAREDAKNSKPDLPTYTRQIVEAGVCDYTCFIEGRRVTYTGYLGEQYSAWFIGADQAMNPGLVRRNTATGHPSTSTAMSNQIGRSPLGANVHHANEIFRRSHGPTGAMLPQRYPSSHTCTTASSSVNATTTADTATKYRGDSTRSVPKPGSRYEDSFPKNAPEITTPQTSFSASMREPHVTPAPAVMNCVRPNPDDESRSSRCSMTSSDPKAHSVLRTHRFEDANDIALADKATNSSTRSDSELPLRSSLIDMQPKSTSTSHAESVGGGSNTGTSNIHGYPLSTSREQHTNALADRNATALPLHGHQLDDQHEVEVVDDSAQS